MWLWVMFDLPVSTAKERKHANRFRKDLEAVGFNRVQFSVYIKHCLGYEEMETVIRKVEKRLTDKGEVGILFFTDKQYGNMKYYWGKQSVPLERRNSEQLCMF